MNKYKVDILAFGAHPDDVECAIGGTILTQIKKGYTVAIIDLTKGELGSSGSVQIRAKETELASRMLGVTFRENLKISDGFIENNTSNKIKVIKMIRKYRPKIVLTTALHDRHPDHMNTAKLIIDASFLSGLKKIVTNNKNINQLPHRPMAIYNYIQDLYIKPDFVIDISNSFEDKLKVIKAYESQFLRSTNNQPNGPNALLKQIESMNSIFGRAVNTKFAEGFTANRYLGTDDIMNLI